MVLSSSAVGPFHLPFAGQFSVLIRECTVGNSLVFKVHSSVKNFIFLIFQSVGMSACDDRTKC